MHPSVTNQPSVPEAASGFWLAEGTVSVTLTHVIDEGQSRISHHRALECSLSCLKETFDVMHIFY